MEIAYAGGKRLLVPLARLDLIAEVQRHRGHRAAARPARRHLLEQDQGAGQEAACATWPSELLKLYAERQLARAPILAGDSDLERQFAAAFPYEETPDQLEAIADRSSTTSQASEPMDRLLVRRRRLRQDRGRDARRLPRRRRRLPGGGAGADDDPGRPAPRDLPRRFEGFPVTVEMDLALPLAGKELRGPARRGSPTGKVDILIGTHRLLSKDIEFPRLGLVIVDEEQRFGVAQKERLKQLKKNVHVLAMSATPLPRTLQLSLAGVRDMSVIETPPKDRMAVETAVLPFSEELVREAIEFELERGGQVFYVYNRVESIEQMAGRAARARPRPAHHRRPRPARRARALPPDARLHRAASTTCCSPPRSSRTASTSRPSTP